MSSRRLRFFFSCCGDFLGFFWGFLGFFVLLMRCMGLWIIWMGGLDRGQWMGLVHGVGSDFGWLLPVGFFFFFFFSLRERERRLTFLVYSVFNFRWIEIGSSSSISYVWLRAHRGVGDVDRERGKERKKRFLFSFWKRFFQATRLHRFSFLPLAFP